MQQTETTDMTFFCRGFNPVQFGQNPSCGSGEDFEEITDNTNNIR
jgi:hypothetical protein